MENGTVYCKDVGVTVVAVEGKVAADPLFRPRAYAAGTPVAIQGKGGDRQTFSLVCALTHGFCLDDDAALILLLEWNRGCEPPWEEDDLRRKIREVA